VEHSDFVRDFGVVVTGAAASLVIFRRLRLPPVLGFLLAGAALGPYSFAASPVRDVATIRLLADVGLVMLLFALGVELGWERIRRVGLGVVLIGALELSLMMGLGYGIGRVLGWGPVESLFLGSAISVSSSAVLVQMLRDRGELTSERGRIIVGILVVEDFAAVIMLSVLAGIASDGSGSESAGLAAVWRLLIFAVSALVFGALLVPIVLDQLAKLRSNQVMLMGALGMCFGLALAAGELGLSAGAGAFLIGTVVGDTKHSHTIARMTEPVRDLFAAIFFVSIGMLVNIGDLGRYIWPVALITIVVIFGKVFANSLGAYLTGRSGRTSLEVGTAMAQPGEFSLAMVKTGTDHGAVSAALSPVVTAVIVVSSVIYPLVSASAGLLERLIERRAPSRMRRHASAINASAVVAQQLMAYEGESGRLVRRSLTIAVINLAIIGLVIVSGIAVLNASESLAEMLHVSRSTVGLIIGGVLVTLSVPPGLTLWKALADVSEEITQERLLSRLHVKRDSFTGSAAALIEHSLLAIAMFIIAVWMTPLLWELVSVGELATPASALIVVATMALTARIALKIHSALEETVERTFLGGAGVHAETASQLTLPVEQPVVRAEPVAAPVATPPSSGSEWQRLSSDRITRRRG
jgi:CPA2 family monovalent cation:H+ antiporter-2